MRLIYFLPIWLFFLTIMFLLENVFKILSRCKVTTNFEKAYIIRCKNKKNEQNNVALQGKLSQKLITFAAKSVKILK